MSYLSIVLFFVYTFCLGFTATSFVKNSENFLERNLMRLGFGLAILPFLALILNIMKIPADWKLILALSLVYPLYYSFRNFKKFNFYFKLTKTDISIFLMLVIFFINFSIYATGAFAYPYLENDDPWTHAYGIKFYSIEKNAFEEATDQIRYINPYPPAYDILLGILHQTNDSVYWTLKFFNALIISLGTIFFYFFVKEFTGNRNKALFAAFALMSIPAFMSHFIWAISLVVPLYFIVFYSAEKIKSDKRWWILTGLAMVTALTTSPSHSAYFGLLFSLYIISKIIIERKLPMLIIGSGILGLLLSFVFWWMPMILRHGIKGTISGFGYRFQYGTAGLGGTGDRIYSFNDFFVAKMQNAINNPIGIGIVLFLLVIVFLAITIYHNWMIIRNNAIGPSALFVFLFVIVSVFLWKTYAGKLWSSSETLAGQDPMPFFAFFSEQSFVLISISLFLLALSFLIFSNYKDSNPKNTYLGITIVWLIASFYAVNAAPYVFKLSPFRAWMILAIPVCILAAEGALGISDILRKSLGKIAVYIFIVLMLTGVYFTSTQQKIAVNTATWHPGGFWTSGEEIGAYIWMKDNLPKNSNVFTFWNNAPVIGMDMYTCHWCDNIRNYMKQGFNQSAEELHNWLAQNNYNYLLIDGQTAQGFGADATNAKIQEIAQSGLFNPVFQNQGAVIFRV